MREFEQMRQALKPNERRNGSGEDAAEVQDEPSITTQENTPMANFTVVPAPSLQVRKMEPAEAQEYSSIVSTGSAWQGNLKIDGSVRVDGRLSGEVEAKGTVLVSEGADVDAKIRAAFVIVAGSFQGQVQCDERLEIMPTGRVNGELTTKSLVVHEGAFVEGQIRMASGKAAIATASHANGAASLPVASLPVKSVLAEEAVAAAKTPMTPAVAPE